MTICLVSEFAPWNWSPITRKRTLCGKDACEENPWAYTAAWSWDDELTGDNICLACFTIFRLSNYDAR